MEIEIANKETNEKLDNLVGKDDNEEDIDAMLRDLER